MQDEPSKNAAVPLLCTLVAVLVVASVLLAWQPWARGPRVEECDEALDVEIARVVLLQDEQKWDEAQEQWRTLQQDERLCEQQRALIVRHLNNCERAIEIRDAEDAVFERNKSDKRGKPEQPAEEEDFLSYYPAGRNVASVATFHVNGMGRNKGWVLQGDVYFAYRYEVLAETTVVENTGTAAVFQVHFRAVNQLRAISEQQVELRAPEIDSPILSAVWAVTDRILRNESTVYRVVRAAGRLANRLDPGLKRTLTGMNNASKKLGMPIAKSEDVEIAEQVESLSGRTLKIIYVRDLGVTHVSVLEGGKLPKRQLEQLAYNSSVLMDYFVFPAADKQVGDRWTVNARDVAGIVNVDYDVETDGTLELEYAGKADFLGEECIELEVVGGEVEAAFEGELGPQSTIVTPRQGSIRFSPREKLIRAARLEWNMSKIEASKNHLLYGVSNEQNVTVESFYQADRRDTVE